MIICVGAGWEELLDNLSENLMYLTRGPQIAHE